MGLARQSSAKLSPFSRKQLKPAVATIIRSRSGQLFLAMFLIVAVVWIARFQHSSEFGIYEDDWTIIPRVVDMSLKEVTDFVADYVTHFRGQGRPLHHSSIYLLSFLGWNLGGLQGIYFLGFVIVSLNAVLFYLLLRRIHSHQLAIIGALAFALYSADTTQAFITHSFGLQTALTLFLLASHSYISRRFALSYGFILLSLLTYETPYLLFVAVPLFCHPWDKALLKVMARHLAILGLIFIGVYLVRIKVGDLDGADLGAEALVSSSLRHMVQGPAWSLGAYIYRSIDTYRSLDVGTAAVIVLSFPLLYLILRRWEIDRSDRKIFLRAVDKPRVWGGAWDKANHEIRSLINDERMKSLLKLVAIGAIMLVLAYPMTFTTEPNLIYGRVTRNHFAAVVGNSLLIAAAWMFVITAIHKKWLKVLGTLVLAMSFAIMLGFGQVVQRDYARGWTYQREFWGELLAIIPDAGEGTAVIVDSSGMKESLHIAANTWNMPRVLEKIVEFPEHWEVSPSVYKMQDGWLAHLHEGGGSLVLDHPVALSPTDHVRKIASSDMILIITDGGMVARQNSPIVIDGTTYPLSSLSEPVLPNLAKMTLFDVLIPVDIP